MNAENIELPIFARKILVKSESTFIGAMLVPNLCNFFDILIELFCHLHTSDRLGIVAGHSFLRL